MLPPEGSITLIVAILIGLVTGAISTQCKTLFGLLGVYLVAFFLALILGGAVEAHAAGKHVFYDFGDNLLHHLAVAILGVTLIHLAILGTAQLIRNTAAQSTASSGQPHAYIPHALGLLNLFAPVGGCVAQLIYWRVKRADQAASDEAKEALQFQAMFVAVLFLADVLGGAIGGIIGGLISMAMGLALLAWLIQTIVAIIKAKRNGSYSYPLSVRLLRRSQLVTPVA
jgi:uncharacterized Tic20 family protein